VGAEIEILLPDSSGYKLRTAIPDYLTVAQNGQIRGLFYLNILRTAWGAVFLFLANAENLKGKVVNFFSTFGRVPFFYYILHLYLIHLTALLFAQLSGFGWHKLILSYWITELPEMKGYGFSLWVVYLVWAGVIVLLYPLCKKFDRYKQNHKEKWWLSYL
jgi:hypothetical protein